MSVTIATPSTCRPQQRASQLVCRAQHGAADHLGSQCNRRNALGAALLLPAAVLAARPAAAEEAAAAALEAQPAVAPPPAALDVASWPQWVDRYFSFRYPPGFKEADVSYAAPPKRVGVGEPAQRRRAAYRAWRERGFAALQSRPGSGRVAFLLFCVCCRAVHAAAGVVLDARAPPTRPAYVLHTSCCCLGRGDPNAADQETFCPSSPGWPPFMRVNPILDWSYHDVWGFLQARNQCLKCTATACNGDRMRGLQGSRAAELQQGAAH